jgi:hypothetical protein
MPTLACRLVEMEYLESKRTSMADCATGRPLRPGDRFYHEGLTITEPITKYAAPELGWEPGCAPIISHVQVLPGMTSLQGACQRSPALKRDPPGGTVRGGNHAIPLFPHRDDSSDLGNERPSSNDYSRSSSLPGTQAFIPTTRRLLSPGVSPLIRRRQVVRGSMPDASRTRGLEPRHTHGRADWS